MKDLLPRLTTSHHPALQKLSESMSYSANNGGKRFRPVLSLWTTETLGGDYKKALPFAAALEMIHCYSLIHDDLPCMDDDDLRRGLPSNHKAYGESTALLAGNALLTEAIGYVAKSYVDIPVVGIQLVKELCHAAGFFGMVGGQEIDMAVVDENLSSTELDFLHSLKTGALIRVAAVGAAAIAEADEKRSKAVIHYAGLLGLAFQIADDLLDYDADKIEMKSYPGVLGLDRTRRRLQEVTNEAIDALQIFGAEADSLRAMALFNQNRKQ